MLMLSSASDVESAKSSAVVTKAMAYVPIVNKPAMRIVHS